MDLHQLANFVATYVEPLVKEKELVGRSTEGDQIIRFRVLRNRQQKRSSTQRGHILSLYLNTIEIG